MTLESEKHFNFLVATHFQVLCLLLNRYLKESYLCFLRLRVLLYKLNILSHRIIRKIKSAVPWHVVVGRQAVNVSFLF